MAPGVKKIIVDFAGLGRWRPHTKFWFTPLNSLNFFQSRCENQIGLALLVLALEGKMCDFGVTDIRKLGFCRLKLRKVNQRIFDAFQLSLYFYVQLNSHR